jgi:hypothetical protein
MKAKKRSGLGAVSFICVSLHAPAGLLPVQGSSCVEGQTYLQHRNCISSMPNAFRLLAGPMATLPFVKCYAGLFPQGLSARDAKLSSPARRRTDTKTSGNLNALMASNIARGDTMTEITSCAKLHPDEADGKDFLVTHIPTPGRLPGIRGRFAFRLAWVLTPVEILHTCPYSRQSPIPTGCLFISLRRWSACSIFSGREPTYAAVTGVVP